jgi:hypothetical protein
MLSLQDSAMLLTYDVLEDRFISMAAQHLVDHCPHIRRHHRGLLLLLLLLNCRSQMLLRPIVGQPLQQQLKRLMRR